MKHKSKWMSMKNQDIGRHNYHNNAISRNFYTTCFSDNTIRKTNIQTHSIFICICQKQSKALLLVSRDSIRFIILAIQKYNWIRNRRESYMNHTNWFDSVSMTRIANSSNTKTFIFFGFFFPFLGIEKGQSK